MGKETEIGPAGLPVDKSAVKALVGQWQLKAFNDTWCKHCKLLNTKHANDGKCLFQPTYFEEVSDEEYIRMAQQLAGKILKLR